MNKEKLLKYLIENMHDWCEECVKLVIYEIIQKIKNGEFDNE